MFTSDKAILAAGSTISFPLIPEWEGTHCRIIIQPSAVRRRVLWMVWTKDVKEVGWREWMM